MRIDIYAHHRTDDCLDKIAALGKTDTAFLGASQPVLGTDFPHESGPVFQRAVDYVTTSGLAPADAKRVPGPNAIALFGRGAFPDVREPAVS